MLEIGDKFEDYTLVRFLGRGQFGEVWLAEKQLKFSTRKFRHALKFLSKLGDEINFKSAEAEIDTWIEASGHPNVMSVLDMLVHGEHIIIASEYAEGGSLKEWLKRSGGRAPSQENALEMMLGILRGIEHLHSRNVVHRDLKPENILLQGNFPRITDFGISRIVSTGSMSTVAMGSPFYMSPESFDGSKSPQTDIWSAGVIMYEMLTGKHPYHSDTIYGLVAAIRQDKPKALPENVPLNLRQIVDKALQKDLGDRYENAQDMRSAIEHVTYELKIRSSYQRAVTERLIDVSELDRSLSFNEPSDENVKKASAKTSELDAFEMSETPSLPGGIRQTQSTAIEATQDAEELAKKQQIEPENEMLRVEHNLKETENTKSFRRKPVVLLGGIAGIGILGTLAIFLMATIFFKPESLGGFSSRATNSEIRSAANQSPAPPSPKAPEVPLEMVYIEGGEFMMGRDAGQIPDKISEHLDETPAHKVSVGPFFMDIYEVTNEKYAEFVKAGHKVPPGWKNGTYPNGEGKFPVVGVNWNDAYEYAKWAGKRLPTEEEWEFAARGNDSLLYPWGNDWKPGNANADGASGTFAEVGKFKGTSPFGIYDMVGNAGEWTASDFKAYPNGRLTDYYAGKSNLKTIRGNNFSGAKDFANAVYRIGWAATGAPDYSRTGFRCAKDVGK